MCKVGAQVGHACSTVTAVNLVRAGHTHVADEYNLQKMCVAAREITEITTRSPCPDFEEVYGKLAFDFPFFMIQIPYYSYTLNVLLDKLGVNSRAIRLNELSTVSEVKYAVIQHFGTPQETGWDASLCQSMWDALHNHLVTGLSRDYNTPLGLGSLYGAVAPNKRISPKMMRIMMEASDVPDHHPTVIEFINRWNRLCAKFERKDIPPVPGTQGTSCMLYAMDVTFKPTLLQIPVQFWLKDIVVDNHVERDVPKLFKRYVVKLITDNERKLQGEPVPMMHFFEQIVKLKLFIEEAESLKVLPLCDDFVIRMNHDFFFGEDHLWLQEVRGSRPKVVKQLMRAHFDVCMNVRHELHYF